MEKKNVEYELKAWAPSDERLKQLVADFSKEGKEKPQEDVYFDNTQRDLFQRGIFIRIRNNKILEIKFNPNLNDNSHLDCEETSFELPLNQSGISLLKNFFNQIGILDNGINQGDAKIVLESFGLSVFVIIEKSREVYTKPGVEFCVDDVKNLGKFIEIEAIDRELSNNYQQWAKREEIKPIPVGYVELYLRKHDYSTYMKGRYLLEEDRK